MGKRALGALIRAKREEQGVGYYALAEELGVTGQLINSIERGKSYPSLELYCRILERLWIDPRDAHRAVLARE